MKKPTVHGIEWPGWKRAFCGRELTWNMAFAYDPHNIGLVTCLRCLDAMKRKNW